MLKTHKAVLDSLRITYTGGIRTRLYIEIYDA